MINDAIKQEFLDILKEELIPAMGCTEPIALAYVGAKARDVLGCEPERIIARCSGNIIKNVRCVRIPNSDGMIGVEAAVALGVIGGDATKAMEVLEDVTDAQIARTKELLAAQRCKVEFLESEIPLHIIVELCKGEEEVLVEIQNTHLNITRIIKNGENIFTSGSGKEQKVKANRTNLNVDNIKEFADTIEIRTIKKLIDKQIRCNMDIAYEGMSGDYGVGIGKTIKECYHEGVVTRMKAYTSAASEARMDGCDMPVIINSGSGNQGIASSVPVIVYAREKNIGAEKLYRALVFSSLLTIYQKEFIGKLSAFCGAVSASCAAGAAITYMIGGTSEQIKNTVGNTLANIPGIICDGAKVSCAAKIATSLDASMMSHYLAMQGRAYKAYTGILKEEAGETISCVGYIGKVGMQQTDKEIIKIMLQ
ncbi:MAG: L-serine ammonia-lyase, iron-sulfur-dependent, subunit alpha [Lachnospiraceae bacterium]|nr:L-serine ammonia-lyase, iron-sulfur-dependent, subunit alpha [Lachnospiraceae bacterium]